MPARTTVTSEDRVAFRLDAQLAAELRALARRDHNGLSATARRLLAAAIVRERESPRS
jgi:hypothetical protein